MRKKIIAHRGVPELSHENTIESFEKAVELHADMIEFDIRRTADGVLVAFHDPFIAHEGSNMLLRELSYNNLQIIAHQNNFVVPLVKDIFEKFTGRIGFDIEFKEEACEEETFAYVHNYKCENSCIVTSFNESVIRKVQMHWSHIPAGLLIGDSATLYNCVPSTYSMLCPKKEVFLENRSFFADWKQNGRYIAVWTVDDDSFLKLLLKDSLIDCIITNRCGGALELQNRLFLNS